MTVEERLDRIEHITAGLGEQFERDREENRALWRQTQEQLDQAATLVAQLGADVARVTTDVDRLILDSAAREKRTGERIDKLVSAIGEFVAGRQEGGSR